VSPPADPTPQAETIALAIVYEDADLIVIDKPASLVVHPGGPSMRAQEHARPLLRKRGKGGADATWGACAKDQQAHAKNTGCTLR